MHHTPQKISHKILKFTYDKDVDAAYLYLKKIEPGAVKKTYPGDPLDMSSGINMDFDANGILLGIEIEGASKKLPPEMLGD